MGGRQSSQRHRSPSEGSSHYSAGSLDNGGNDLLSGPSGSLDLAGERPVSRRRRRRDRNDQFIEAHSLPAHLFPFMTSEIKCPVCNKRIGTNEIETHLLECLAKPRVSYNEDVLEAGAGECIICFEDMVSGEHIARLPCLCIYHKKCLDEWFNRNRCCPAHPDQIPQEYTDSVPSTSGTVTTTETETEEDVNESSDNNTPENTPQQATRRSEFSAAASDSPESNTESTDDNNRQMRTEFTDNSTATTLSEDINAALSANRDYVSMDIPGACPPQSPPGAITEAEGSNPSLNSHSNHLPIGKTVVHVDDGSMHGSPSLFDEDEIAQLASKIKTILVQESPRSREYEGT